MDPLGLAFPLTDERISNTRRIYNAPRRSTIPTETKGRQGPAPRRSLGFGVGWTMATATATTAPNQNATRRGPKHPCHQKGMQEKAVAVPEGKLPDT